MSKDREQVMVRTPEAGDVPVGSVRVANIIRYLLANQRSIGSIPKGAVTFHFAGASALTAEVTSMEDLGKR